MKLLESNRQKRTIKRFLNKYFAGIGIPDPVFSVDDLRTHAVWSIDWPNGYVDTVSIEWCHLLEIVVIYSNDAPVRTDDYLNEQILKRELQRLYLIG